MEPETMTNQMHLPTRQEILRERDAIRHNWTEAERRRRARRAENRRRWLMSLLMAPGLQQSATH